MSILDDGQLIEQVECFSFIYNKNDPSFEDKIAKESDWQTIAAVMGVTPQECEQRWTILRNRFSTELRLSKNTPSGSQATHQWPLFKAIQFLIPFVTARTVAQIDALFLNSALFASRRVTYLVARRFRDVSRNRESETTRLMSGFGKSGGPKALHTIQGAKTRMPKASTSAGPLPLRRQGSSPTTQGGETAAKRGGVTPKALPASGSQCFIPGPQPFSKCTKCGLGFSSAILLRRHVLMRKCGDRNKCLYCGMVLTSYKGVRAHERKVHLLEYAANIEALRPMSDAEVYQTIADIEAKATSRSFLKEMSAATGLTADQVKHRRRRPDYAR
ncbi:unnamed protein product [Brassicogethes aeneus]|uniref:MADF domain-containing protein n=1 Tax=Brassicogethes aeneus TaxID=1431903 RepID=A0A9P0FML4_BRAAE|nr:unnamed protein product [Brassicogethes aeneus]